RRGVTGGIAKGVLCKRESRRIRVRSSAKREARGDRSGLGVEAVALIADALASAVKANANSQESARGEITRRASCGDQKDASASHRADAKERDPLLPLRVEAGCSCAQQPPWAIPRPWLHGSHRRNLQRQVLAQPHLR